MSQTSDDVAVATRVTTEPTRSGPVAELALVAAGLGVVVYLLGFVTDFGIGSLLLGPLLVGGGLLAGTAVLPGVGNRMLVPAAVAVVTGALLLLQVVVGGTNSAVVIAALVLALLEAAAAVGAVLLHLGVVSGRMPTGLPAKLPKLRRKRGAAAEQARLYPGYPPRGVPPNQGQAYPGQPVAYPGLFDRQPGDQYAGEHAYAQNARYGAQYGVPGYPPPPYGYDPGGYAGPAGPGRADAPAPDPRADPVTVVVPPTGPSAESPAASAPPSSAPSSPLPAPAPPAPSESEATDRPPDAAGAHRAPDPDASSTPASGSHRAVPPPPPGPGAADDDEQDRTRVLPTVPKDRPPS